MCGVRLLRSCFASGREASNPLLHFCHGAGVLRGFGLFVPGVPASEVLRIDAGRNRVGIGHALELGAARGAEACRKCPTKMGCRGSYVGGVTAFAESDTERGVAACCRGSYAGRIRPPIALATPTSTRREPSHNTRRRVLRPPGSVPHRRAISGVSFGIHRAGFREGHFLGSWVNRAKKKGRGPYRSSGPLSTTLPR